ncbi:MAG: beta-hydroxyacyl-ACP dehydratase [Cyclobacteriaceae bacterium]|nr:beta-hydroxyacyl-ACP dehydratase [Cyclobacteriaceae bacterium HetDA_MAG_MS6]
MRSSEIIAKLPYKKPFLFVDELTAISESGVTGHYTYQEEEFFYAGHFPGQPITPGVILTETMAQIGLVSLGIFLISGDNKDTRVNPIFSSCQVDFLNAVYPGEKVTVNSSKIYFRFGKLKCEVVMTKNNDQVTVCKGQLSGMLIPKN